MWLRGHGDTTVLCVPRLAVEQCAHACVLALRHHVSQPLCAANQLQVEAADAVNDALVHMTTGAGAPGRRRSGGRQRVPSIIAASVPPAMLGQGGMRMRREVPTVHEFTRRRRLAPPEHAFDARGRRVTTLGHDAGGHGYDGRIDGGSPRSQHDRSSTNVLWKHHHTRPLALAAQYAL